MKRGAFKLWVKLAVSAVLIALILAVVPWRELWDSVVSLDASTWALVWLGFVAGHALGVLKWRFNVNLGIRNARARLGVLDAAQCYAAGMFANLCLPTIVGGDAIKAILAAKITGRPEAAVIGGLTERLIDTLALVVLIVAGALWSADSLDGWAQSTLQVGAMVAIAGAVLFTPFVLRMRLARWPRKLRRTVGRALVALRRLTERPQRAVMVLALSLVIQGWFVLLNRELGRGIGVDAPLAVWFFAVPMAKAITLAPISFGGFGLREVTLAGFFEVLANTPPKLGAAASTLWQTVVVATGLLGGPLWYVLGWRSGAKTGAGHGALVTARDEAPRGASAEASRDG